MNANRIHRVALLLGAGGCLLVMASCAVGRRDSDGAIILGVEAGTLAETGTQALAAAANAVLPGSGTIIGAIGAAVLGAGALGHKVGNTTGRVAGENKGWSDARDLYSPPPPTTNPTPSGGQPSGGSPAQG